METRTMRILAVGIVGMLVIAGVAYVLMQDDEEETEITLAFGNSSGWQPLLYAYHAGLFEAEGVNVKVHTVASSGPSTAALLAGKADMAFTSPEPVFEALKDDVLKVKLVANSRVPRMNGMHALYGNTNADILSAGLVKQYEGDKTTAIVDSEAGLINFVKALLNDDGTLKSANSKVAVHAASSHMAVWLGYVELLYKGSMVYGIEYPGSQMTPAQYTKLTNINSDVYISCPDYATAAASVLTGKAYIGLGTSSAMSSAAGASANPAIWSIMSVTSMIDGGFSTILVSEDAMENKYDAVIKVLRAYDKAGALMRDVSTSAMVARVVLPFLYDTTTGNTDSYMKIEMDYYASVDWDICSVDGALEVFELIAKLTPYLDSSADFGRIYDQSLIDKVNEDVHQGGVWKRTR